MTKPLDGTCDGCVSRHYVRAHERGTSMSGWGCLQTGGHAVKRCSMYSTGKAEPQSVVDEAAVKGRPAAGRSTGTLDEALRDLRKACASLRLDRIGEQERLAEQLQNKWGIR